MFSQRDAKAFKSIWPRGVGGLTFPSSTFCKCFRHTTWASGPTDGWEMVEIQSKSGHTHQVYACHASVFLKSSAILFHQRLSGKPCSMQSKQTMSSCPAAKNISRNKEKHSLPRERACALESLTSTNAASCSSITLRFQNCNCCLLHDMTMFTSAISSSQHLHPPRESQTMQCLCCTQLEYTNKPHRKLTANKNTKQMFAETKPDRLRSFQTSQAQKVMHSHVSPTEQGRRLAKITKYHCRHLLLHRHCLYTQNRSEDMKPQECRPAGDQCL